MEKIVDKTCSSDDESLLQTLQQRENWEGTPLCLFQGCWCPVFLFHPLHSFHKHFKSLDTDIVIASLPKSGTTWLKALLFSIVNCNNIPVHESPLLTNNPHKLVSSFECWYFLMPDQKLGLDEMAQPRILSTHLPHQVLAPSLMLAHSLIESRSKIVYVSRNPFDQFVSEREFLLKIRFSPDFEPLAMEQSLDMLCDGVHAVGPFWDHILGYWRPSLENPDKVLLLKYEDMKKGPVSTVKKIAKFLGMPFTDEQKEKGVMEEIGKLCNFEKLKDMEINKSGMHLTNANNSVFFRKGEIRNWKNHLSPDMAERLKQVVDTVDGTFHLLG